MDHRLLQGVAQLVQARAGLAPPLWQLRARLHERAAACGQSLSDYLRDLDAAPTESEILSLVDALRVGETRFFRHRSQLATLRAELPTRLARASTAGRALRIWCAGCASGEEVWTLAMLLAEARAATPGLRGSGLPPEVLGTDISKGALATAQAGVYERTATVDLPADLAERYLTPAAAAQGHDRVQVAPLLRDADLVKVRFVQHNLLARHYPGTWDLILCRNVLIYFDEAGRREIVDRLRAHLADGGALLLSPSEQEAAPLTSATQPGPEATSPVADQPPRARERRSQRSVTKLASSGDLHLSGNYGDGTRLKDQLRPYLRDGQALLLDLDGADYLDEGDARVLRRAAEVIALRLRGSRPGVRRFLSRHGLDALCDPAEER